MRHTYVSLLALLAVSCTTLWRRDTMVELQRLAPSVVKITVSSLAEPVVTKKMSEKLVDLIRGKTLRVNATGTGFVVDVDRSSGKSFVMTASHVCRPADENDAGIEMRTVEESIYVTTFDGRQLDAKVFFLPRDDSDTCFIAVDGVVGDPLPIALVTPEFGSYVYTAGCPHGAIGKNSIYATSGMFLGSLPIDSLGLVTMDSFSISTSMGSSGSPVMQNGNVVSVITMVYDEFRTLSFGPQLDVVSRNVAAMKALRR